MSNPEPNEKGLIPCDCCRNGKRKNMQTKKLYTCNYCNGTLWRKPPTGYSATVRDEANNSERFGEVIQETLIFDGEEYCHKSLVFAIQTKIKDLKLNYIKCFRMATGCGTTQAKKLLKENDWNLSKAFEAERMNR